MGIRTGLLVSLMTLLGASAAHAQAASPPGWDTSMLTGLFLGHPVPTRPNDTIDDFYNAATLAITAGRYLTPHLKAEGELFISGEGRRYVQHVVTVPGVGPYPVGAEQIVRTNGVSANLAWQFFENQWAHPFVFGGVELDFDRTQLETWPQSYYRGDPRVPGNEVVVSQRGMQDLGTSRRLRGVVGTGAKLYMTPRTFFRTDARVAIGADGGHASFRLGFGVDF